MDGYWAKVMRQQIGRRRVLAATGAASLGAALLAACGGSSKDGRSGSGVKGDSSGLLIPAVDDTKSAQRGGTFKFYHPFDQQSLDPMFTSLPNQGPTTMAYSELWHYPGGYMKPSTGEIKGDIAESWEWSPDKMQLTVKLTDKARFAPVAPVNGRAVNAQDILFTWQRFKAQATRRFDVSNEVNPDAPVISITNTDARTVVIKLSQPYSVFEHLMASTQAGNMFIVPREAENQNALDLRRTQLGSGPWYLENYTPSVSYTYKRNPGFKQDERNLPYMDQIDMPIISEYAQQLAQLKNGSILSMTTLGVDMRPEDLLPTKREVPAMELISLDPGSASTRTFFGMVSESPFKDERVRQAWSMSIDRDLFIDVRYNVSAFEKEGLPMATVWDTALPLSAWTGWWIDPKGQDWAKFFNHDISEAKKLLSAAGFPNGVEANARYPATGYPNSYYKEIEMLLAMTADSGFKSKQHTVNFNTEWRPQLADAKGHFEGVSFIVDTAANEPVTFLYAKYNVNGSLSHGFDPDGKSRYEGDPTLNDLTTKSRLEFDEKKRQALVQEIQKYDAKKLYFPRPAGGANTFNLAWPALRGRNVYHTATLRDYATNWIDPTKPPIKSS